MTKKLLRNAVWRSVLCCAVLGTLSGCHKDAAGEDPQHDVRTEVRRDQECADPQWKAANLGLWYNICPGLQN